jgi:hypothetical protein
MRRYPTPISAALALGCALSLSACAHYGWAGRGDAAGAASRLDLAVTTVAIAPHHGADAAELTRFLVERMHREGLAGARWRAPETSPDAPVLRCAIEEVRHDVFEATFFVEARAACDMTIADGEPRRLVTTGRFAGRGARVDSPAPLGAAGRRSAALAAMDALERIAVLARAALDEHGASGERPEG